MSLTSSVTLDGFFVQPSGSPDVATFKSFQYTLLTRGSDIRRQPGITVQDVLNNTPNTCSFTVDGGAPVPQVGEKIEIRDSQDSDRRLFAGTVQSIDQIYEGQVTQVAWRVTCIDFTWLLNRRRPFGQWVNTSVSQVVQDLLARYAPGFTTTHVQTNLAKVTVTLDGSMDLVTVLNNLGAAIGGGHWYVDYDQDVHFFHVVPPGLTVPIGPAPANFDHMTVALGSAITQSYDAGYYVFRHSFLYSDGTESQLRAISNVLQSDGAHQLVFTGIPTGASLGTVTCIGRRIYYNRFITGFPGGEAIEKIRGFCQINDNTTTGFSTNFGVIGASVATIAEFGGAFTQTFTTTPAVLTPALTGYGAAYVKLSDQAADINLNGGIANGLYYGDPAIIEAGPTTIGTAISEFGPGTGPTYKYRQTFRRVSDNKETAPGPASNAFVGFGPGGIGTGYSGFIRGNNDPANQRPPAGYVSSFYRTKGNGSVFYQANVTLRDLNQPTIFFDFTLDANLITELVESGDQFAQIGWIGYDASGALIPINSWPRPRNAGDVYFASPDVAAALENAALNAQSGNAPKVSFAGHLTGPATPMSGQVDTVYGTGIFNGISVQFKYAFLYRDGSVSFPSAASQTLIKKLVKGQGVAGYQLSNIAVGPTVDSNEVVARFIYFSLAGLQNPNFNVSYAVADGFEWPIPFKEPDWSPDSTTGIGIIPDNVTTALANIQLGALGTVFGAYTGIVCGAGNRPYNNSGVLSLDPIPIWPNPDGPFLEDVDPPADIDELNTDLLHEDSGSQPFTMSTDLSQIRNRVTVIGSGSITTITAAPGDFAVFVADISAFSPSGGTVKYNDPATGEVVQMRYKGVAGVPGQTSITLDKSLTQRIPQGTNIANYYMAEDIESQKFLAKIELDKDGKVTDGIHEYTIVDTSLKAVFQLFMRAHAELELFSKPVVTIRYSTRDPKSRSGQTVHVDLSTPPCVGDFLIQSVTIDQIHDESDQLLPRYTVTASSSKFDLNDLLLKIIGGDLNAGGSGNSSAGIVASGVSQAETQPQGLPNPSIANRKWSSFAVTFLAAINAISNGLQSGFNSTGNNVSLDDPYPGVGGISSSWVQYRPVLANANLCGISSTAQALWEFHPKLVARFRTRSALYGLAAGNHRAWWIALVTGSGLVTGGNEQSVSSPHVALFAKDPGDNGGSWGIQTFAGSISQSNVGFAPILPNTHYRVTITSAINSATVVVEDLTRNLSYTANASVSGYDSVSQPGTANDKFFAQIYASATNSIPEVTAGNAGIDIGAAFFESD